MLRKISSGTSGADVYLLRQPDETILAAKVIRDARVPASVQQLRRDLLAHHLPEHTPRVLATASQGNLDVLVTAAPSTQTLDDAVDRHSFPAQLGAVWSDVVDTLVDLGHRTAASGFDPHLATRNHELRCHRGLQGMEYALAGNVSYESRIVVDGDDCGTWTDLFASLTDLGTPVVHVTCHGDPTASPSGLTVDYAASDLPRLRHLGQPAATAFARMAGTDQDMTDVARHLALLLLREIPRAAQHHRSWRALSSAHRDAVTAAFTQQR